MDNENYIPGKRNNNNQQYYNQQQGYSQNNQQQGYEPQGYNQQQGYSQNTQQGYYTNQGYNQNQQQGYYSSRQPQYTRTKRKKKHKFLKFLLLVILIIVAYKLIHKLIQDKQDKFFTDNMNYPFELSEDDTKQSIKNDFDLITTFADEDGKEYNITWETNSSAVSISDDGHVAVNSVDSNKIVELTAIYKTLLAKSEITYDCIVTTDKEQTYSQDDIIDISAVENNTCGTYIQIAKREDESIEYIYGDFGDVVVNNEKDAISLAELYRDTLGIDSNITLSSDSTFSTNDATKYTILASYNGITVENNYVSVCVDNSTFKPIQIMNMVTENTADITDSDIEVNPEDYYSILTDYLGTDEFAYSDEGTYIVDNKYYEQIEVYYDYYNTATAYIDKNTLEVISLEDDNEYSSERLTDTKVTGVDEYNNTVDMMGQYSSLLIQYSIKNSQIDVSRSINKKKFSFTGLLSGKQTYDFFDDLTEYAVSSTPVFNSEYAVETEAMSAMQTIYDFYLNNFGIDSYNGKGSVIKVVTNVEAKNNNACWNVYLRRVYIGTTSWFTDSMISDPVCVYHEYTHGVFNNVGKVSKGKYNSAINEAYADVMALLVDNSESWRFGEYTLSEDSFADLSKSERESYCMRDLSTLEQSDLYYRLHGDKGFKYYDDEGFSDSDVDEHKQGILLGHLAYEMYKSGYWTREQLAEVWMKSLMLGVDTDSFVGVRRSLINAADSLGYSKESQRFIAEQCDAMHIYDIVETSISDELIQDTTIYALDDTDTVVIESTDDSVKDDVLLDNDTTNRYLVFYSATGIYTGKSKLYIYQAGSNDTGLTDKEISKLIEDKLNTSSNLKDCIDSANELKDSVSDLIDMITEGETNLDSVKTSNSISVEYKHIPNWGMDLCEKILNKSEMSMREYTSKATGADLDNLDDSSGIFSFMKWLVMDYYVIETTAYDLYNGL